MIFYSRCVLLAFVNVRSYSTFIRINVKASDVVEVKRISSIEELTGVLRTAGVLETVSAPFILSLQ